MFILFSSTSIHFRLHFGTEDPLHVDLLRPGDQCREGLPRAALGGRDHHERLRAGLDDGEVRPTPRDTWTPRDEGVFST